MISEITATLSERRRHSRLESVRLRWSFAISLLVHLLIVAAGSQLLWPSLSLSSNGLDHSIREESATDREIEVDIVERQPSDEPTFIEVPPSQVSEKPPESSAYYSSKDSVARSPDLDSQADRPKLDGTQEVIPKTADVLVPQDTAPVSPPDELPKPELVPEEPKVQPDIAEPLLAKATETEKSQPLQTPLTPRAAAAAEAKDESGWLERRETSRPIDYGNQSDAGNPREPARARPRPRKLAQVSPPAAPNNGMMVGAKMRQDGGVARFGLESSLDVRSTEFGAYDAAIVMAIQRRWYDLIESRELPRNETGKVVLEFRLYADGRIGEVSERESEVSPLLGLLCQRAVTDPSPYAPWPSDLRRLVGKEFRQVRFVFHYN